MKLWVMFKERWEKIDKDKRKVILERAQPVVNCLTTALLLSIPVTLITGFAYWKSVVALAPLIVFFEHYYKWLRRDWKNDM